MFRKLVKYIKYIRILIGIYFKSMYCYDEILWLRSNLGEKGLFGIYIFYNIVY